MVFPSDVFSPFAKPKAKEKQRPIFHDPELTAWMHSTSTPQRHRKKGKSMNEIARILLLGNRGEIEAIRTYTTRGDNGTPPPKNR